MLIVKIALYICQNIYERASPLPLRSVVLVLGSFIAAIKSKAWFIDIFASSRHSFYGRHRHGDRPNAASCYSKSPRRCNEKTRVRRTIREVVNVRNSYRQSFFAFMCIPPTFAYSSSQSTFTSHTWSPPPRASMFLPALLLSCCQSEVCWYFLLIKLRPLMETVE